MSLDNKRSKQQRDQAADNVQNIINARHATPSSTQAAEQTDQSYTIYLWPSRVDVSAITADLVEAQVSAVVKSRQRGDQIILEPTSEREKCCFMCCADYDDALTEDGTWDFVKASEPSE
jgi:hypothetical protein